LLTLPDADSPDTGFSHLPHHGYRRPVVADWRELVEGDSIVLLRLEKTDDTVSGTVDAVAPDGSLIWLLLEGAGRRMFHHVDGYKTLLEDSALSERRNHSESESTQGTLSGVLKLSGQLFGRPKSPRP
jgi:hypothetical protein